MTTLSDFISQVKTNGLSKTNKYMVVMGRPTVVSSGAASNLERLCLFCDQVQLPGLNISSTQNRTFGEVREAPYEKLYESINMGFYVDANLEVKYFFDQWFAGMQDNYVRQWAFYKDYTTDITISVINDAGQTVYQVYLAEAYPKNISAVQMDYSGKDVMKIQVAMNYKYWRSSRVSYASENSVQSKSAESYGNGYSLAEGGFDYQGFLSSQGLTDLEKYGFNVPTNYFDDFKSFQTNFTDRYGQVKEEVAQVASLAGRFF